MTDYLEIPDFLKLTAEERAKAWEGKKLTDPRQGYTIGAERWAKISEIERDKRKAKNARGLARLKELHANEYYDRRKKQWLPRKEKSNS